MIQVSREELISNIEKYLNMAINDEQIMIMDGKIELAALVKAARYNTYRPVGNEYDWYEDK